MAGEFTPAMAACKGELCVLKTLRTDLLRGLETGLQVSEDVVDVLQSHRQTHQTGGNSGGELLLGGELRVCRGSRVDNQASHITNVGDVAKQRDVVDQCATCIDTTLDLE